MADECVVGIYDSLADAQRGIEMLHRAGYTPEQISLVTRHSASPGKGPVAAVPGDDSLRDAAIGGALGGMTGALGVMTLVTLTGVGVILMTGPLVAMTGAIVGALLGAMKGWGVRDDTIHEYEERVKEGKVLVIVTGDPERVEHATPILRESDAWEVHLHARASDDSPEVDDRPAAQRTRR